MKAASVPGKFQYTWAQNAAPGFATAPIPATASGAAASQSLGFPPITAQQVAAGGIPPNVADWNGFGSYSSQWAQWFQAGGPVVYDAAFSTWIGGYPYAACLMAADYTHLWFSTADDNASDPDTGGANWISIPLFNIALLTSPAFNGNPTAPTQASNDSSTKLATTAFVNPGDNQATTGHMKFPNGLILQWGHAFTTGGGSVHATFDIPFTTAVYQVTLGLISTSPVNAYTGYDSVTLTGMDIFTNAAGATPQLGDVSYMAIGK